MSTESLTNLADAVGVYYDPEDDAMTPADMAWCAFACVSTVLALIFGGLAQGGY